MSENPPPIFDVPIFNPAYFLEDDTATAPPPSGATNLEDTLIVGNNAGTNDIDMNNQDILNVNDIALTTINGGVYPVISTAFQPVNDNNGVFAGSDLTRTIATDITFNGGVLVVFFSTSGFRGSQGSLILFTLRCFNSNNQQLWEFSVRNRASTTNLTNSSIQAVFTGIPAQTGAFLQLVRNATSTFQDSTDRTNVSILELPLS